MLRVQMSTCQMFLSVDEDIVAKLETCNERNGKANEVITISNDLILANRINGKSPHPTLHAV